MVTPGYTQLLKVRDFSTKVAHFLLIPAFFFLPIQAAPVNSLLVLAMILWLFTGNLLQQLQQAWQHPLSKAFLFFAFAALISLLWTEDINQGLNFSEKYIPYIVFPILVLLIRPDFTKYYLGAFFAGIALSELLSYAMWLGITDMGKAPDDPNLWDHTAFIGHVLYSPIVAFAAYIMLSRLVLGWEFLKTWQRASLVLFSTTIIVNLFFTHGRTGMVALLGLLFVLFFLRFPKAKFKAIFLSLILATAIPSIAYHTLDDFKQRVDVGREDFRHLFENQNAETSLGHRVMNWHSSLKMIEQQPVFGVGIGDYAQEYEQIMQQKGIQYWASDNPHNQYLFSAATSGILGTLSLAGIFLTLAWLIYRDYRARPDDELNPLKVGFLVLFMIICLAESYLWRSNTTLVFVLFSALFFQHHLEDGNKSIKVR